MRKKRNLFEELDIKCNYDNNNKSPLDIDISKITEKVNNNLNSIYEERKIYMKHKIFKATILSAVITLLLASSVFALSPTGQKLLGDIISYFKNDDVTEITDIKELEKYNNTIGVSDVKGDYTLTLDNIAIDDNFIHIFYTITSNKPLKSDDISIYDPRYEETNFDIFLDCRLNGKLAGINNNNINDGYYINENKTYKGVKKYNISSMDIPDNFNIELYSLINSNFNKDDKFYSDEYNITEDDKKNILYVSTNVDKSKAKIDTITKDINKELKFCNSELEKVIFSPFGNQLIIKSEPIKDSEEIENPIFMIDCFALYDENGKSLDVLNIDLKFNTENITRNSFEFLKADNNTKQLNIVPFHEKDVEKIDFVKNKIGKYPITYEISEYGKVVVTDIRISNGKIEIDYYKDGFVEYDPGFELLDDNGNNAEPGGKLKNIKSTQVNYNTNSYTAIYRYDAYDDNGIRIPADDSVSAQNLKKSFTNLAIYKDYIEFDYDNAVTIDLK